MKRKPDLRPWHPISRYGVSPMPTSSDPVEVIRDSGVVHLAIYAGNLWREQARPTQTLNTLVDRVAFWRELR
jgi:hypothetical protein